MTRIGVAKNDLVFKSIDDTVLYFIVFFIALLFVQQHPGDAGLFAYHFNISKNIIIVIIAFFFIFMSITKQMYVDDITFLLLLSVYLGVIPFFYAANINSYWGNFLPLIVSLVSYHICRQSKIDFSKTILWILYFVCLVLSIQVIAIELSYFSNLYLSNLTNTLAKSNLKIPIGDSNLIAAYLLPLVIFIVSFKKNIITFIVVAMSTYALILCRSKNALILIMLLLFAYVVNTLYHCLLKDTSLDIKYRWLVLIIIIVLIGMLLFGLLTTAFGIISKLKFSYDSPYNNEVLKYMDTITSGRVIIFQNELIRFSKHPFLGNGFGYNLGQKRSHNWIIEIMVQRGIIGLLIYLLCIEKVFKTGMRFYKKDTFVKASVNMLCVVFIQGLFEVTVSIVGIDFLIWSISGFLMARAKVLALHGQSLAPGGRLD